MNIDEAAKRLTETGGEQIPGELVTSINRFEVVEVHPGDIIFLSIPDQLSDKARERLNEQLKTELPNNRVIILEKDLHVDCIVRPEAANEPG